MINTTVCRSLLNLGVGAHLSAALPPCDDAMEPLKESTMLRLDIWCLCLLEPADGSMLRAFFTILVGHRLLQMIIIFYDFLIWTGLFHVVGDLEWNLNRWIYIQHSHSGLSWNACLASPKERQPHLLALTVSGLNERVGLGSSGGNNISGIGSFLHFLKKAARKDNCAGYWQRQATLWYLNLGFMSKFLLLLDFRELLSHPTYLQLGDWDYWPTVLLTPSSTRGVHQISNSSFHGPERDWQKIVSKRWKTTAWQQLETIWEGILTKSILLKLVKGEEMEQLTFWDCFILDTHLLLFLIPGCPQRCNMAHEWCSFQVTLVGLQPQSLYLLTVKESAHIWTKCTDKCFVNQFIGEDFLIWTPKLGKSKKTPKI